MGAWIEIEMVAIGSAWLLAVAPLVGAWIEIWRSPLSYTLLMSLPSWERGLKSVTVSGGNAEAMSLPSWERGLKSVIALTVLLDAGRSPRGSVD